MTGTLLDLFMDQVATNPRAVAVRHRSNGAWLSVSWRQWESRAREIARALIASGLRSGDRVALMSSTRLEWLLIDVACWMAGVVLVPLYTTAHGEAATRVLEDADVRCLIVETPALCKRLMPFQDRLRHIRTVVALEDISRLEFADEAGRLEIRLDDLMSDGEGWARKWDHWLGTAAAEKERYDAECARRVAESDSDTLATIVYTSGTTGRAHGVMLTHRNLLAEIRGLREAVELDRSDEQLLFLPLSHILARVVYLAVMAEGASSALSDGVSEFRRDLAEVRPTFFVGVPQVFKKAHQRILARVSGGSKGVRRVAVERIAHGLTSKARKAKTDAGLAELLAEHVIARPLRKALGGRLRFAISGGAPLNQDTLAFFEGAGVTILEGYGLTESCGAVSVNRLSERKAGSAGRPLAGVEVRVNDEGEILIRGETITQGYWGAPDLSKSLFEDGWLRTGDIGAFDDGWLYITGRMKELIVTSGAKNIAPAPIEGLLKGHPAVSHALVYGDKRSHLVALLIIDHEALQEFGGDAKGAGVDIAQVFADGDLEDELRKHVDSVNAELSSYERIRNFAMVDLSVEPGSRWMTASGKLRRGVLEEHYRELLDGLYVA